MSDCRNANILTSILSLFSEERLKDGDSGDLASAVASAEPVQDKDEWD